MHIPQTVPHPPDEAERAPVRQPARDRVEHASLGPVGEGFGQAGEVAQAGGVDPDEVGVEALEGGGVGVRERDEPFRAG